jgi:hypothetical protein
VVRRRKAADVATLGTMAKPKLKKRLVIRIAAFAQASAVLGDTADPAFKALPLPCTAAGFPSRS